MSTLRYEPHRVGVVAARRYDAHMLGRAATMHTRSPSKSDRVGEIAGEDCVSGTVGAGRFCLSRYGAGDATGLPFSII